MNSASHQRARSSWMCNTRTYIIIFVGAISERTIDVSFLDERRSVPSWFSEGCSLLHHHHHGAVADHCQTWVKHGFQTKLTVSQRRWRRRRRRRRRWWLRRHEMCNLIIISTISTFYLIMLPLATNRRRFHVILYPFSCCTRMLLSVALSCRIKDFLSSRGRSWLFIHACTVATVRYAKCYLTHS